MSILKYFNKVETVKKQSNSSIILSDVFHDNDALPKKRGSYMKLSLKEKAEIERYASEHGIAKARRHFKDKQLKDSSIRDWRKAYETELKAKAADAKPGEVVFVSSLTPKRLGRPPLLGELLDKKLQAKIFFMRSQQVAINSSVVISVAKALLLKNKMLLSGPIYLEKEWARHFLKRMGFSKRRVTSTSKLSLTNFDEHKKNYLCDIWSIVKMEDIPDSLILNWDQTEMKIIPTSSWTIEKSVIKRVEITAADDKRQITGVFAGSLAGDFLPIQVLYQGTTPRCLPKNVNFPKKWHLTYSQNHWSNESTMIDYVNEIVLLYVNEKKLWVLVQCTQH